MVFNDLIKKEGEEMKEENIQNDGIKFVIHSASNYGNREVISIKNLKELLDLIKIHGHAIIVDKNHYLENYEKNETLFRKRYNKSFVKEVEEWKRQKAYHEIIIYDDYIE